MGFVRGWIGRSKLEAPELCFCDRPVPFLERDPPPPAAMVLVVAVVGLAALEEFSHGEAVAIGMVYAAEISLKKGNLSSEEFGKIVTLLKKLGLPIEFNGNVRMLKDFIKKDKKRENSFIHFILLEKIGKAVVKKLSIEELELLIDGFSGGENG